MAIYRVLGDQLVQEDEFRVKGPELIRAMESRAAGNDPGPSITLDNDVELESAIPATDPSLLQPFTPIRFGEPLTVDIRHVYTGSVGAKGWYGLGDDGDIAVCSGVKEWSAFKASARALNWVAPATGKRSAVPMPTALQNGTRLIAYQKAVATRQLIISVEIASAPPESGLVALLSGAFTAAAGIPLLMPYAGALVAAGQILPAVGKLLEAITNTQSEWAQPEELNFGLAGAQSADAGFRVIARSTAGLQNHRFDPARGLVDKDGQLYEGDDPYVVIAVDGAPAPELENFTAAVTGAELLRRFRMGQTGQSGVIDGIVELTTIISDVKFRTEALGLQAKMNSMGAKDKKQAQLQFDALIKNIIKPELVPTK